MLYRTMKKTGDSLSVLGFGCMRLPQKKGQPGTGRIDEARATRQIRHAIDRGVNYLDTGMLYHMGRSEPFLGQVLTDGYREKVKIATKLPPWSVRVPGDMEKILSAQIEKLRTDRIDYYLLHGIVGESWKKMTAFHALEFLDRAKRSGRILHAGFSFHGDLELFKEIVDSYDWEFCQIQYNYLDEKNQAGRSGLEYAAGKDLGVVIMEPLRGGNLAKKIPAVDKIWQESAVQRTPAEWALRWVWNHPGVTVVLSGMNDEKQVEENLRIADEAHPDSLTPDELLLVHKAEETYRGLMRAGCTGCHYCMPCPAGVDIPTCFEFYNNLGMFGEAGMTKINYVLRTGGLTSIGRSFASLCKECGKCEKACPQGLPIHTLLKGVVADLEPWWFMPATWALKRFFVFDTWKARREARKARGRVRNTA
jgi:predicted aldo/keto reductase-like oxidoreductase